MPTYLTIKQQALQGYNPRQMVTGTTATAGTTTIIPDTNRQEPQGEWDRVDSWLKITSVGSNNGLERRVTGFSAGISITVAPALLASVGSGSTYQLVKTFTDSDVGLAVNSALRDLFPDRIIESVWSAGETSGAYTMTVPSAAANAIAGITRIGRAVASTNSASDYTPLFDGQDYTIDEVNGVATLITAYAQASGASLKFHYRRPVGELSADTDVTDEPMSLILAGARKWLALFEGDDATLTRMGREFEGAKHDYAKDRSATRIKTPIFGVRGTW